MYQSCLIDCSFIKYGMSTVELLLSKNLHTKKQTYYYPYYLQLDIIRNFLSPLLPPLFKKVDTAGHDGTCL